MCGRARGYQKGLTTGFADPGSFHYQGIDGWYGDTLALVTYNSPRQHVWSYVAGIQDNQRHDSNCPCADGGGRPPPTFVGANYYCESGAAIGMGRTDRDVFYFNDPLWDGAGCITSHCCDNTTQPWFITQLSAPTTSDLEARICGNNAFDNGALLIDQLQVYIQ